MRPPDRRRAHQGHSDSIGLVRAVRAHSFRPKMVGGGMIGPQNTAVKTTLGPLLNGFENRLIELQFGTGEPAQVHVKRALEGVASERRRTADLVASIVLQCHARILTSW